MIKLIVTDIDGTLVKDGTLDIDPEYLDVFGRLMDKGIRVVMCSGRAHASMAKLFSPIKDRLLYITDGGTIVRSHREIWKVYPMENEVWRGMYDYYLELKEEGCDSYIATPKLCYAEDENTQMYKWCRDSYKFPMTTIPRLTDLPVETQVVKYSIYHPKDCESICKKKLIPDWMEKAQMSSAGKEWIDCVNKRANKGEALRWLQSHLGITPEETCAFGDNINDIEMIQNARYSYAVGNAREELKDAAVSVIAPYWEKGVLKTLKSFL